ncbi:phospholipid scramblase 1-like [Ischnura elegans]|uniref:phospholipid scramblase 1-like n=1 Tax=Ischnura elegans TaxID=197161 RepID=UPI001ED874E8|nr:phospholipid scramblase 1-like [Ischnura elegans]
MSEFRMAEFGSARQYGNGAVEERPPYAEISSGTCAVINTQPTYNPQGHPRSRPIIPVAIVGNQQPQNQPEFQRAGIDVLGIADEIYVQQTVELLDLVAAVESENRYLIKVPRGDTIFEVAEKSSGCQRAVIGAARSFVLMIFDRSRNEVLRIYRMAACTCCFMYCCCLQNVEVYSPHSNLLGSIRQEWSMLIPTFSVRNAAGDRIYRIEGPSTFMFCVNMEDNFKIMSCDGTRIVGSISNIWNDVQAQHNLHVVFPRDEGTQMKAVLLGAAFLLQYMFFERSKRASRIRLNRFTQ